MERIRRLNEGDNFQVAALRDLDALVGRHITFETPRTHWEDSQAFLRFDSREEAIEAVRDPNYRKYVPNADWKASAVREVKTFRHYSSDLAAAWEVIQTLSDSKEFSFRLQQEEECWSACFDGFSEAWHKSVCVAICLAALKARGFEVVLHAPAARQVA